jgi:hypothetical protein
MKIINIVANQPIFIKLQYLSLKRFISTDFEYIVFNDGKDWPDITNFNDPTQGKDAVSRMCNELNITCITIPNESHREMGCASRRHGDSLRFVVEYMKNNVDEYLMLDSDMFLIDHLDIQCYREYDCACVLQQRGVFSYIWPNLFYINMNTAKHLELFDLSIISSVGDTGSASHKWLESFSTPYPSCDLIRHSTTQYTNEHFYFIRHLWSCSWNESELPSTYHTTLLDFLKGDPRNVGNTFFCEIYDNKILHYRGGTNWMNQSKDLHDSLIQRLNDTLTIINLTH